MTKSMTLMLIATALCSTVTLAVAAPRGTLPLAHAFAIKATDTDSAGAPAEASGPGLLYLISDDDGQSSGGDGEGDHASGDDQGDSLACTQDDDEGGDCGEGSGQSGGANRAIVAPNNGLFTPGKTPTVTTN